MILCCCHRGLGFQLRFAFERKRGLGLWVTSWFCLMCVRSRGALGGGQGDVLARDVRVPEWRARGGERRRYRGPQRVVL
jgi:hypothetical protein